MTKICSIILLFYFFTGCATTQKPLFYWGNYSSSLYNLKKAPTEENLLKHKETLLKIMQKSDKQQKLVPPGIYGEYGYILMKEGNNAEAFKYFDLEETTYPESKTLIERLKLQLKKENKLKEKE